MAHFEGRVDLFRDIIYLNASVLFDIEKFLSAFFHEYCHIQNKYNRKYVAYHNVFQKQEFSFEDYLKLRKVAYKAELYTDKCAKSLMKKLFPDYSFIAHYNQPWAKTIKQSETKLTRKYTKQYYLEFKQLFNAIKKGEDNILDF